ncbi:hypothetical protein ABIE28_001893 [Devosia sp. 2618]
MRRVRGLVCFRGNSPLIRPSGTFSLKGRREESETNDPPLRLRKIPHGRHR